jgi:hypothetical protein
MAAPPALPAEIPIPESVDFVWEMGLRKISDQIEMFDALDSKTGVIVGFVVVSIVELLGFLIFAAAEAVQPIQLHHSLAFSCVVGVFFFLGLLLSILSTWLGLQAIRVRQFAIGFDYGKMLGLANLKVVELKAIFLDDLLQSVNSNERVLNDKVRFAKASAWSVLVGLMCYTIVVAVLFVSFIPRR